MSAPHLVRDIAAARTLAPISMKGISRDVVPYAIEGTLDASGRQRQIFSEHLQGLDLEFDPSMLEIAEAERARAALRAALVALDARNTAPG